MEMTVGYGRKLRPDEHNYEHENEEASIFFKGEVSDEFGDVGIQAIADMARTLFAAAKVRVLTELGLEFESDENGVVREVRRLAAEVVTQFPGSTIVQQVTPAAPVAVAQAAPVAYAQPAPVPMAPPAAPAPMLVPAPPGGVLPPPPVAGPTKQQLIDLYLQDPTQWYDNRGSKTSEWAPDFRHKTIKLPPNKNGKVYNAGINVQDFIDAGYQI